MTEFGEKLSTFKVTALSPDKNVQAVCVGSSNVKISMREPEAYEGYRDAGALADQISVALERVFEGAKQGRSRIVDQYPRLRNVDRSHWDADVRRNLDAQDQIVSEGTSPDASVTIETVGLRQWTVRIKPGALSSASSAQLFAQVNLAIRAAQRVHATNLRQLRVEQSAR